MSPCSGTSSSGEHAEDERGRRKHGKRGAVYGDIPPVHPAAVDEFRHDEGQNALAHGAHRHKEHGDDGDPPVFPQRRAQSF